MLRLDLCTFITRVFVSTIYIGFYIVPLTTQSIIVSQFYVAPLYENKTIIPTSYIEFNPVTYYTVIISSCLLHVLIFYAGFGLRRFQVKSWVENNDDFDSEEDEWFDHIYKFKYCFDCFHLLFALPAWVMTNFVITICTSIFHKSEWYMFIIGLSTPISYGFGYLVAFICVGNILMVVSWIITLTYFVVPFLSEAILIGLIRDPQYESYIILTYSILINIILFTTGVNTFRSRQKLKRWDRIRPWKPRYIFSHGHIMYATPVWILCNLICTWARKPAWYIYLLNHTFFVFYILGAIVGYNYRESLKEIIIKPKTNINKKEDKKAIEHSA